MQNYITVDEYIKSASKEVQPTLRKLRAAIKKGAPKATEKISYGMPFYEYGGTGFKGRLVYFGIFKKHISLFLVPSLPFSVPKLEKYRKSKATYQFLLDKPLPLTDIEKSIRNMVKARDAVNKKKTK